MTKKKITPVLTNLKEVHQYIHAIYRREFSIIASTGREFLPYEFNSVILRIFLEDAEKDKPIMDKTLLNCLLVIVLDSLGYKLDKANGEYGYTRSMKEPISAFELYRGYTNILKANIIISNMKNVDRYSKLFKQENPNFKNDDEEAAFTWYSLLQKFSYDAVYSEPWLLYMKPEHAPETFE